MQTISMRQRINSNFYPKQVYKIRPLEDVDFMLPDLMKCLESGSIDLVQDCLTVDMHVDRKELLSYMQGLVKEMLPDG